MATKHNPKPLGASCTDCPHRRAIGKYVLGEGPPDARLVVIGEAPGIDEELQGHPFIGRSGQLLDSLLKRANVDRSEIFVTNVLKCRPLTKIKPGAIECCLPNLLLELQSTPEDVRIIAMGGTARDALLPDLRGRSVTSTVGYWYDDGYMNRDILPTWHPAYVLRNPKSIRELADDVQRWACGRRPFLPTEVHFLETAEELASALSKLDSYRPAAIDLETSGYHPLSDYVLCVSFSQQAGVGYVFPGHLLNERVAGLLLGFDWIGHNFKFDSEFLIAQHDLYLKFVFDTMLAHYCFDERQGTHALKHLANRLWDVHDYETPMLEKYLPKRSESFEMIIERGGREELFTYAATDADYTYRLYEEYRPLLEERGWLESPFQILIDASNMYTEAEVRGFRVDVDGLDRADDNYAAVMDQKRKELAEIVEWDDINPNSTQQVARVLYDQFGLDTPQVRTRGYGGTLGARTTCTEALEELEKTDTTGFVRGVREYRRVSKMRGTYIKNIRKAVERDGDGRFHHKVRLHGTVTGRLASSMIMLIPARAKWRGDIYGKWIKNLFIPSDGMVLFDADYSQIELRLFGWLSGDQFLFDVYNEGRDLHDEVSAILWGKDFPRELRGIAKQVNYGYVYGGTAQSLGMGGELPREIVEKIVSMYDEVMPTAVAWRETQLKIARRQGYSETPFGRRRRWPLVTSANMRDVFKQSVNFPIQSLASDFTLTSAIRLWKDPTFRALGARILVTVHDSIVGEVPIENASRAAEMIRDTMLEVPREVVGDYPMGVDVAFGFAWGSMHGMESDADASQSLGDFLESIRYAKT